MATKTENHDGQRGHHKETFDLLLCSYLASLGLKCVGDREELEMNPGLCPLVQGL